MEETFAWLFLYVLPVAEIVITIIIGIWMVGRSKESKNQAKRFIGKSLIVTAMLSIVALIWLAYEYNQTYSWGKLIIVSAPFIPVGVITIGTILAFSGKTVYSYIFKNNLSVNMSGTKNNKINLYTSIIILFISIMAVVWVLLPQIYLLPYRALSYEGGFFGEEKVIQLRLHGYKYFSEKSEDLIILHNLSRPNYAASLNLKLSKFAVIELSVRRHSTNMLPEEVKTYYLPIEKSLYYLINGVPVKVK